MYVYVYVCMIKDRGVGKSEHCPLCAYIDVNRYIDVCVSVCVRVCICVNVYIRVCVYIWGHCA